MTRPQRQRKDDRLIHPGASVAEVQTDLATGPFDRAARAMDLKWGVDRLPELVSPETAARFGSALGKMNAAISDNNVEEVVARVGVCVRGMAALDQEAERLGHKPIVPQAIELTVDGVLCALLTDDAAWPAYLAQRPGVRVYTLREVSNALAAYGATVAAVKDAFPRSEVTAVRSPLAQSLNDEIPFSPETRA